MPGYSCIMVDCDRKILNCIFFFIYTKRLFNLFFNLTLSGMCPTDDRISSYDAQVSRHDSCTYLRLYLLYAFSIDIFWKECVMFKCSHIFHSVCHHEIVFTCFHLIS